MVSMVEGNSSGASSGLERETSTDQLSFVDARSFNTIGQVGNKVVKSGKIEGEVFYYTAVQKVPMLRALFPLCEVVRDAESGVVDHIVMERIVGTTFSRRLVTGVGASRGQLDAVHLEMLLATLHALHHAAPPEDFHCEDEPALRVAPVLIHTNYALKLEERFNANQELYLALGDSLQIDIKCMFHALRMFTEDYSASDGDATGVEAFGRAMPVWYIHGDPVFSNVLLLHDHSAIKLIDMRGRLGDGSTAHFTTQGDALYDLSKVFQSLMGYDFMILSDSGSASSVVSESAQHGLASLRQCFWTFLAKHYPFVAQRDIEMLTAQHFFGIVPLHSDHPERQVRFIQAAAELLRHQAVAIQFADSCCSVRL